MFLPVLDKNLKKSAEFVADVHLNNMLWTCTTLLSTAVHVLHAERIKPVNDPQGLPMFDLEGFLLPAPAQSNSMTTPWVRWLAAEYQRAWWLIQYAFFLDKERMSRFPGVTQSDSYLRLHSWLMHPNGQITRFFPKAEKLVDDFPVVVPHCYGSWNTTKSPVEQYRDLYKKLTAKHRMKWTLRGRPGFMGGTNKSESEPDQPSLLPTTVPVYAKTCGECGVPDVDPRVCSFEGCPGKKNYNL